MKFPSAATLAFAVLLPPLSAGLDPAVEKLMGLPPGAHAVAEAPAPGPRIGFFLAEPYSPEMAVPADTVQLYIGAPTLAADGSGPRRDWPEVFKTWTRQGYFVEAFLHSRYGSLIDEHARNVQTDRHGRELTFFNVKQGGRIVDGSVGPISPDAERQMEERHHGKVQLERADRYEIPTLERVALAQKFYAGLLTDDVAGFCFDEPEIWANAGYSTAFQEEWQAYYGEPWRPPHESVENRVMAEQLKAVLVRRWVETILNDVKRRRPGLTTMLALHSQPGYVDIGMGAPHTRLLSIPTLDEIVAEVWNLPFDSAYLQYSSFLQQLRGTGKKAWMMLDPWGDSPALTLEYYQHSYRDNLVAALLFPDADRFEPLIWPNRLYGHIPKDYETIINTVAGALNELRGHTDGRLETGSRGFGTFVSDSMSWQRSEPSPSDFDGFYGLASPLVQRGVPVEAYSLDRAAEPGYLADARCLLLSYDFLKPMEAAHSQALARWVREGGALVCAGGTDAYNSLRTSWWVRAGAASPLAELFSELGLAPSGSRSLTEAGRAAALEPTEVLAGSAVVTVPLGPGPGAEQCRRRVNLWQIETDNPIKNPDYPVTLYPLPSGATALYRLKDDPQHGVVAWEAKVGRGSVLFVGVAPGFFKTSAAGADLLRTLAARAFAHTGSVYHESPWLLVRRGPYVAVHTMQAPGGLPGRYVDLLSPTLAVRENPVLAAESSFFLQQLDPLPAFPRRPIVSGRLRAAYESPELTSFVVAAPAHTAGVARLVAGGRKIRNVSACTTAGAAVKITAEVEADTVLLRFDHDAAGVVVRLDWEPVGS